MKTEKGYSRLRKGRFSIHGHYYHLILKTQNRRPYFSNFHSARQFIRQLKQEEQELICHTLCFTVMPDHVHWLVEITTIDLSTLVQRVKSRSTKRIGRKVWQQGFYDHAIRDEEKLIAVARYIVANPLRAGLVEKIGDYPHWDSVWLK